MSEGRYFIPNSKILAKLMSRNLAAVRTVAEILVPALLALNVSQTGKKSSYVKSYG